MLNRASMCITRVSFSIWFVILLITLPFKIAQGQLQKSEIRSLSSYLDDTTLNQLEQVSADSASVAFLLDVGYQLETPSLDTALLVYTWAALLSDDCEQTVLKAKAFMYSGIVCSMQGDFDRSLTYYAASREIFETEQDILGVANVWVNEGVVHYYRGDFDQAAESYVRAVKLYDEIGEIERQSVTLGNLGAIWMEAKNPEKAVIYFTNGLDVARQMQDTVSMISALVNLGHGLSGVGDTLKAVEFYIQANNLAEMTSDYRNLMVINNNLSDLYTKRMQYSEAYAYSLASLTYARSIEHKFDLTEATMNFGHLHLVMGNLDSAAFYLLGAKKLGEELEASDLLASANLYLSEVAFAQNNYRKAYRYLNEHLEIRQSIFSKEQMARLNDLEVRYQTAQKDKRILAQNLEIERNQSRLDRERLIRNGIVAAGLLSLIIFGSVWFNLRQKRLLDQKRMDAMEKEKQLNQIQAFVDGEEEERRRIARDLHDGMSSSLSATKLMMEGIKSRMQEENRPMLQTAIEAIDTSSKELRRISHNMLPEVLLKYGLVEALETFIQPISSNGKVNVVFQHYGVGRMENSSVELVAYRVIQELINNVLKYAAAGNLLIQLNQSEDQLYITVEDDGKGFVVGTGDGVGMKNVKDRVSYVQGELNIESSPGKGSTITITLPLDPVFVPRS